MPTIRIKNTFPNITRKNTSPNIKLRNSLPNIGIKNTVSHPRIISGGSVTVTTTGSGQVTFGGKGYPIGLLFMITDIKSHTNGSQTTIITASDFKPSIRIRNI